MADIVRTYTPNIVPGGDLTHQVLKKLDPEFPIVYQWLTALRNTQPSTSSTRPANPNLYDATYDTDDGLVYRWGGSAWIAQTFTALNVPERQTVLSGPMDSGTGLPTLITTSGSDLAVQLNASASAPVVISFADGMDSHGAKDVIGYIDATDADFWSSLTQNTTNYLYFEHVAGVITGGYSVVAPVYQTITPTHGAGKHWINPVNGLVKVSDGSAWTTKNRVFCAAVVTDLSGVTSSTIYPYGQSLVINQLKAITGKTNWYDSPSVSLETIWTETEMPSAFIPAGVGATGVAFRCGRNATYNFCYVDCLDLAGAADAPTGLTVSVALNGSNQFTTGSITTASTTSDITDFNVSAGDLLLFTVSNTTGVAGGVMVGLRRVRR